ncbi:MAG TPA: hypothetical protein VMY37_18245 [Thermoguttaceae bacterium]|nr:hypothetical protein [Thermoguttaceae bacterium]
MATADLQRPSGMPSPLQVDLAVARVDLAALRARQGREVDERARAAAELLHNYYSGKLQAVKNPVPIISKTLVPNDETRQALEEGLASMAKGEAESCQPDEARLSRVIELLSILAKGRCKRDDAKELHSLLLGLEAKRPAPLPTF